MRKMVGFQLTMASFPIFLIWSKRQGESLRAIETYF